MLCCGSSLQADDQKNDQPNNEQKNNIRNALDHKEKNFDKQKYEDNSPQNQPKQITPPPVRPIIQPQLKEHKERNVDKQIPQENSPQNQPQQITPPPVQPIIQPQLKEHKERNVDKQIPQENSPQNQPEQITPPPDRQSPQQKGDKYLRRLFEQNRKSIIPSQQLIQQQVKTPLPDRFKTYKNEAIKIRENLQQSNPEQRTWFSQQFFERHHQPYHHYGHSWSRQTNWRSLSHWLRWQETPPIYYSDEGYSVIISPDSIEESQSYESPEGDWLSLGVFAVGKSFDAASFFAYIQLSINKQGDVAGTYYNHKTQILHSLSGFIDQESQILVWGVADVPNAPLVTVGVYNLTQDIAPAMIHFAGGGERPLILLRLNP